MTTQMTRDEIEQLIREQITEQDASAEVSSLSIPFHVHNGIDSPDLGITSFIVGSVLQTGGVGTITDSRISTDSIVVATSTNAGNVAFQATAFNGSARLISSDGSSNTVNYLITYTL